MMHPIGNENGKHSTKFLCKKKYNNKNHGKEETEDHKEKYETREKKIDTTGVISAFKEHCFDALIFLTVFYNKIDIRSHPEHNKNIGFTNEKGKKFLVSLFFVLFEYFTRAANR